MPRSNWKGTISFGLVSIPIVLFPSRDKQADISFHQIDKRDNARIKYQRINAETGKEVPWEQITRGYQYDKETTIPVPDDVLTKVAGANSRSIDIETFISKKDLDMITIDNTYYLVPDKKGDKGYVILREALVNTGKIGIARVIISTKEYVAAVMPYHEGLILCLLKYDKEMRKIEDFDIPTKEISAYKVNKKEIEVAQQLINAMSGKWRPDKFKDEYQEAIHQWVDEAVNDVPHKVAKKKKAAKPTNAVDFVGLLRKSLSNGGKAAAGKKTKTSSRKFKHIPASAKHRSSRHVTKH